IPLNSPLSPGQRGRSDLGWQFAWGEDWQPTPAPELGDTTRDAIGFCARRLPDGLGQRLQTALDTEGSLFMRDGVGETVMIYAPAHGLAARIRFGD
ncbi:MAG: hypothetical protein KJP02_07180, partial [Octadecabacter sp.]|nr:hypothetical protein [Octadecabacter sp.]